MKQERLITFFTWLCCLSVCLCCSRSQVAHSAPPRNVIFFIGDGMGFEHVKAAGMYANGQEGTLSFENFAYQGQLTTHPADFSITDSAAAATAIATGEKVNNGVISVALPGDGLELQTLLEYFKAQGKMTGLLSTAYISHATPAAFGAHEPSRNNYTQIVNDYFSQTRPNLLLGGANSSVSGMTEAKAQGAGYTVLSDRAGLEALDTNIYTDQDNTFISGQFPGPDSHMPYEYSQSGEYADLPHLAEMTATALDILDNDADGFFLMVEGGRIDHAAHDNRIEDVVFETVAFDEAVRQAIDWAAGRSDTLIVVTADHETGGLTVLQSNGQGTFPTVSFSSSGHTAANVPIYAWGLNAQIIQPVTDNTELFAIAIAVPGDATGDGFVGADDLVAILRSWGQSGASRGDGDLTGDGFVGADDYVQVLSYWGTAPPPEATPEPASLGMLLLCGLAVLRRSTTGRIS